MKIDVKNLSARDRHVLLGNMVVPRPISLVSTVSAKGTYNLAPYSLFNVVCYTPAMVFITPMRENQGDKKDTLVNIEQTGEFVINLVTEDLMKPMTIASHNYAPEIDEFKESGLTPAPSDLVKPPRVAESPFSLECRLVQITPLGEPGNITAEMILGSVLQVHVADRFYDGGKIDSASAHLVGRMGLGYYTRTRELFRMGEN